MGRPRYWIGPTLVAFLLLGGLLGWTLGRRVPPGRALADRARDLLAGGQARRTRDILSQAVATHPDATLWHLLGQAHRQEGDHDEAERCWRQALALDSNLSAAWLSLGRLALERDQPTEAVGLLERALALSPQSHEVIYTLSLAQRRLGHLDVAEGLRERARGLREAEGPPRGGMGSMPEPVY